MRTFLTVLALSAPTIGFAAPSWDAQDRVVTRQADTVEAAVSRSMDVAAGRCDAGVDVRETSLARTGNGWRVTVRFQCDEAETLVDRFALR
jgi:hypothetical protein